MTSRNHDEETLDHGGPKVKTDGKTETSDHGGLKLGADEESGTSDHDGPKLKALEEAEMENKEKLYGAEI